MSGARPNWFVAWPIAPEGWLERLPPPPARVRRFHSDDLHATIAFFGAVDEKAARRGFDALTSFPWVAHEVVLGRVRLMGSPRHGSALAALLDEGQAPVVEWMRVARDPCLAAAGARPDERAPLPHVTLARIQRRASRPERRAAIAWAEGLDLGAPRVRLGAPALYTWSTDRRERLFRIVAERRVAG